MRRSFVFSFPLLALLVTALVAGDGKKKVDPDRSPSDKDKGSKGAPFFDAGAFLKAYDKDNDGSLRKDELPERFHYNWDRLDANKDGKLSRAELQKGVFYLQPRRRPSDVVFVLVEMSDSDEECAEELQIIYSFLRKLDTNNDGKIQPDALQAAREGLVKKRVDTIFKNLDADNDGKISQAESRGRIKEHFDELDTNKDGQVDRKELTRAASEKPPKLPPVKGTTLPRKNPGEGSEKPGNGSDKR